jgi:archaeal flagellin FlaB
MRGTVSEEGFTGLEAAIVLIAFVVVAAVFSYVVLGAGFFTTQKSQEVVHTGVQQASSTLEVVGNVYGVAANTGGPIDYINFSVALAPGGTAIDFDKVVLTYSNATQLETLQNMGNVTASGTITKGQWGITRIDNTVTPDNALEKGEQFTLMAYPSAGIVKNDQFTIDVKPAIGAAFSITRTAPASILPVNVLY